MHKKIITLTILVVVIGLFITMHRHHSLKKIALFCPALHPAMKEIEYGVRQALADEDSTYELVVYNALGDQMLLKAQAEEIARSKFEAVIPVGAVCSQTMLQVVKKQAGSLPIIFTAVSSPEDLGISDAQKSGEVEITGVVTPDVIEDQFIQLLKVKSTTKSVLLVFDPTQKCGLLKKVKDEIAQLLLKYGVTLKAIEIGHATEIPQRVPAYLEGVDVLLVLKDHTVVSGIDALITLAQKYDITLYASDLDSGKKGAALSYGVQEKELGLQAGAMALEILQAGKKASELPFKGVYGQRLEINQQTAPLQGLRLPHGVSDE